MMKHQQSNQESIQTCHRCQTILTDQLVDGLCPHCLMGKMFDPYSMDDNGEVHHREPMSIDEVAQKLTSYEILSYLGRGGMGMVYKARQKTLDRIVAIKLLANEKQGEQGFSARFAKEAKMLAQMSHANIVTIHDFGEIDHLCYLVMEFVDGVNLRDLLREGKLAPELALSIISPLCDALEYAHEKGIIHRDIKPENLLLDKFGRVKIADFGIASLAGRSKERSGTPPYMAPELESGVVDRRSDIYALGVVFYELLTGERPENGVLQSSRAQHMDEKMHELVTRAMKNEPDDRYQTALEFKKHLETMMQSSSALNVRANEFAEKTSTATPPPKCRRFSRFQQATLLLFVSLVTAMVIFVVRQYRELTTKVLSADEISVAIQHTSESHAEFGPVKELIVPRLAEGKPCLLDLNSGELQSPPNDLVNQLISNNVKIEELPRNGLAWLQEHPVHVMLDYRQKSMSLLANVIAFQYSDNDKKMQFDTWPAEHLKNVITKAILSPKEYRDVFTATLPLPTQDTLAFVTNTGAAGVLEVLGPVSNDRVKIRYKMLQPWTAQIPKGSAWLKLWSVPVPEPFVEITPPSSGNSRSWRMTASANQSGYILATVSEFDGREYAAPEVLPNRKTSRLIRTPDHYHSEDISFVFDGTHLPDAKVEGGLRYATKNCIFLAFGQKINVGDLDYSGAGGLSFGAGAEKSPILLSSYVRRRFRFISYERDPAKALMLEFELRSVSKAEAEKLARESQIELPNDQVSNWSATLRK